MKNEVLESARRLWCTWFLWKGKYGRYGLNTREQVVDLLEKAIGHKTRFCKPLTLSGGGRYEIGIWVSEDDQEEPELLGGVSCQDAYSFDLMFDLLQELFVVASQEGRQCV